MAKITTVKKVLEAVRENGRSLGDVPWGQLNLTVPAKAEVCLEVVSEE